MAQAARKLSDIEADWDRKSHSAAVDAAKAVINDGINGRSMISSLSDIEWGWIAAACMFAWIKTKAQQAVAEGRGYDETIRSMPHRSPEPWEAGAVETILPLLGELELPWDMPVAEWPKDTITSFAWQIHRMVDSALAARDQGATDKITRRIDVGEREFSAANGGSLLTRKELDDDIPF
jgi:hypothetical protein